MIGGGAGSGGGARPGLGGEAGRRGSGSGFSTHPVRYSNGEVQVISADVTNQGFGVPWGHTRSYSNQLTDQAVGTNGNSWQVAEWPYVVESDVVAGVAQTVCVVAGTIYEAVWFGLVSGSYQPQFAVVGALVHDPVGHQYLYTNAQGYVWKFYDYSGSIPTPKRGQFKSFTDLGGNESVPSYDATTHLITSYARSGGGFSTELAYVYYTSGANAGQLQSVTLQVNGADVSQAIYEYYGAGDAYGSLNDLMRMTQLVSVGGGLTEVLKTYYRYYKDGDAHGFAHALKYVLGPEGYGQMVGEGLDPTTATNSQVAAHASNYFRYDGSSQAALLENASGGSLNFGFAYTPAGGSSTDYNVWVNKTVETLADGTQNVVYTNFAGQVMLNITQAGSDQWFAYNQYDAGGRILLAAHSSAVASYSESDPGLVTLHASAGFIESYGYYTTTDISVGAVAGYLQYRQVQQGSGGTPIPVKQYQYTSRTALGVTIYLLWKEICYPDASDSTIQLQCHIYTYTWQGSTLLIDQMTTTFPVVSTGENGSGSATSRVQSYDGYGYLTWAKDERGFLTNWTYDLGMGALTELVQDVNTSIVTGAPSGWTTPTGGGLNLVTDYTVDGLGRVTQVWGPVHDLDLGGTNTAVRRATWMVYLGLDQVWRGSGYYVPGTGASTLINPVSLTFLDQAGRTTDQIQAVRASTSGPLVVTDSFPQSSWVAWTHQEYAFGFSLSQVKAYFKVPGSGAGSRHSNYSQTNYGYDRLQRLIRTETPGRTITRSVYNPMGWVTGQWVGTNDHGATDSDPTGGGAPGNNMVLVRANVYDGGATTPGGDGNLTQQTAYQDATVTRVTGYAYDFRDRQTVINGEIDFCQVNTYDNLDRVTQVDRHDTTTSGHLIARSVTNFDALGRVYQSIVYAVDPSTGAVGNALTSNTWYDPSGNVIQVNQAGASCCRRRRMTGSAGRPSSMPRSTRAPPTPTR